VGEHEAGSGGRAGGQSLDGPEDRLDPVPLIARVGVRGDRRHDRRDDRCAHELDLELVQLSFVDEPVGAANRGLLEAGADADGLVAQLPEVVQDRRLGDRPMDGRTLGCSRIADERLERRDVGELPIVEERAHAQVGDQVVRVTPSRDIEPVGAQAVEERRVVVVEEVLEDVGSSVAVEQDHVDVRGIRWRLSGGVRGERCLPADRRREVADPAELDSLENDREGEDCRQPARDPTDPRPVQRAVSRSVAID
jgi:hypothetical protein